MGFSYTEDKQPGKPSLGQGPILNCKCISMPIGQFSIVCPKCLVHLKKEECLVQDEKEDGYNRTIRTYYGWHLKCNTGCQVIQFKQDGIWLIHKFRLYTLTDEKVRYGDWIIGNPLPNPPLVMTGPGGDFTASRDEEIIGAMDATLTSLKAMTSAFEALKKYVMQKK